MEQLHRDSTLHFYLNDTAITLTEFRPDLSLLDFIRSQGLKGTKKFCSEGGCGACSVLLTYCEGEDKRIVRHSVTSCLLPLAKVDGMVVTTIEGIGSINDKMHPIQKAIVDYGATQCGYCTPGFVITLVDTLCDPSKQERIKKYNKEKEQYKNAVMKDIEDSLDGNLCRCTGYRSILNAAQSLIEQLDDISISNNTNTHLHRTIQYAQQLNSRQYLSLHFVTPPSHIHLKFSHVQWYRPTTLNDLLQLKFEYKENAHIASGCTEIGLQMVSGIVPHVLIDNAHIIEAIQLKLLFEENLYNDNQRVSNNDQQQNQFVFIDELHQLSEANCILVGAAVTFQQFRDFCEDIIHFNEIILQQTKELIEKDNQKNDIQFQQLQIHSSFITIQSKLRCIESLLRFTRYFSSNHVRSVATLIGNICLCSPVSDMVTVLTALVCLFYF